MSKKICQNIRGKMTLRKLSLKKNRDETSYLEGEDFQTLHALSLYIFYLWFQEVKEKTVQNSNFPLIEKHQSSVTLPPTSPRNRNKKNTHCDSSNESFNIQNRHQRFPLSQYFTIFPVTSFKF
jgi:hypothetical protein